MSNHLPLAIMWKQGIEKPGRVVDSLVSFIDFAPTFMTAAGIDWDQSGMSPSPGRPFQETVFRASDAFCCSSRNFVVYSEKNDTTLAVRTIRAIQCEGS